MCPSPGKEAVRKIELRLLRGLRRAIAGVSDKPVDCSFAMVEGVPFWGQAVPAGGQSDAVTHKIPSENFDVKGEGPGPSGEENYFTVIRITISPAACEAIAATLASRVGVEPEQAVAEYGLAPSTWTGCSAREAGMVPSNILQRVFCLRVGQEQATGFTIEVDGRQYVVTCRHLLAKSPPLETIEVFHNDVWKTTSCAVIRRYCRACSNPTDIPTVTS
jgi:hypothetical protein